MKGKYTPISTEPHPTEPTTIRYRNVCAVWGTNFEMNKESGETVVDVYKLTSEIWPIWGSRKLFSGLYRTFLRVVWEVFGHFFRLKTATHSPFGSHEALKNIYKASPKLFIVVGCVWLGAYLPLVIFLCKNVVFFFFFFLLK